MPQRRDRTPKNRLIDSAQISSFVPRDRTTGELQDRAFRVVYPDRANDLALEVRTKELLLLAEHSIVVGVIDKRDFLLRAVLIASVHAAWRVIRGLRRPVMPALFISRPRQSRGAKHWKIRHDRANGGRMGRTQQLQTKVQSAEEYSLRMNEVFDIRAAA